MVNGQWSIVNCQWAKLNGKKNSDPNLSIYFNKQLSFALLTIEH